MRRNATLSVNLADGREFSVNLFVDGVGQRLRAGKIGPWRFLFFSSGRPRILLRCSNLTRTLDGVRTLTPEPLGVSV